MRLHSKTSVLISAIGGIVALLGFAAAQPIQRSGAESPIDFARDVRPILADKCFACHGPDDKHRLGGFRLDLREGATELRPPIGHIASTQPMLTLAFDRAGVPHDLDAPAGCFRHFDLPEPEIVGESRSEVNRESRHLSQPLPHRSEVSLPNEDVSICPERESSELDSSG